MTKTAFLFAGQGAQYLGMGRDLYDHYPIVKETIDQASQVLGYDLRHLIEYAPGHLKDNGYLLLEHGWKQGEEVRSIFWQNHWQGVANIRDYGDN